jgi:CRP-like cAMP-binding protein
MRERTGAMSARFPAVPIPEPAQEDSMPDEDAPSGLRERIARQGEDALGKLAQELLENPLVNSAISRAFEARERAVQAQEAAMGALNIPSAADVERLTRRLRSVSQRMEGIEEAVDRLDQRLAGMAQPGSGIDDRLSAVERQLAKLASEISHLAATLDTAPVPVPREQERMKVDEPPAATPARRRTTKTTKTTKKKT